MNENRSNLLLGAIVGLLVGLGYCYWKQLTTVYQNKDIIGSGSDLFTAADNFISQVRGKI